MLKRVQHDGTGHFMTDLDSFRSDTRAWLEANCPAEMRSPFRSEEDVCWGGRNWTFASDAQRNWLDAMAGRGWTVPDLPADYGGRGLSSPQGPLVQGGISCLLFDMATPGVSTRPILLISGNSPFCETFFDDVQVPKAQIVGEVNKGWDVAKYLLGHEREMISGMGLGGGGSLGAAMKPADPLLRAEIAAYDVDALAFQAMSERFTALWKAGEAHPASPSMMKYAGTELNKRRNELGMAAGGSYALECVSERSKSGKAPRDWLRSKGNSIEGGTSEIQLNIIAKHILRLPGA